MNISVQGTSFNLSLGAEDISKGLSPTKRIPNNSGYLITCIGAVNRDNVLQTIDILKRTVSIDGMTFPYPQIFALTNFVLLFTPSEIYEVELSEPQTVTMKLNNLPVGTTWSVCDYHLYIYMTNGKVAVVRDSYGDYSTSESVPMAMAACDFNGQVILGGASVNLGAG